MIEPILEELDPPATTGWPRMNQRDAPDGIIYRMCTGVQWNRLPRVLGRDQSIYRTFQVWQQVGVIERIWSVSIEHCEELGGVNGKWQSADVVMGKARFGGIKRARTQRIAGKTVASTA